MKCKGTHPYPTSFYFLYNNWISVKLSPLFSFEENPLQSNPHQKKEPPQQQISRRGEWSHNSQLQSYPSQSQGTQKGSTNEASSNKNKTRTQEQAPTIRCSIKNYYKISKRVRWGSIPEECRNTTAINLPANQDAQKDRLQGQLIVNQIRIGLPFERKSNWSYQ